MRTKRRRESAWRRVGRGMAGVAGVVLAAFLVAWGVAFAAGVVLAVARMAEGVAAVVRPVIRVAGAVALWLAGLCAVGNWVLVVGNWLGKTRASLVPVYGVLLGGFAWWASPEGSVWRGVAVAVVVLDPGTWMIALAAAEHVAKRVFGRGGGTGGTGGAGGGGDLGDGRDLGDLGEGKGDKSEFHGVEVLGKVGSMGWKNGTIWVPCHGKTGNLTSMAWKNGEFGFHGVEAPKWGRTTAGGGAQMRVFAGFPFGLTSGRILEEVWGELLKSDAEVDL